MFKTNDKFDIGSCHSDCVTSRVCQAKQVPIAAQGDLTVQERFGGLGAKFYHKKTFWTEVKGLRLSRLAACGMKRARRVEVVT